MKSPKLILAALLSLAGMQASAAVTSSVEFDYKADMAKQTVFKVRLVGGQLQLLNPNVSMKMGYGQVLCSKGANFTSGELYLGYATVAGGSLNKAQTFASDWTINPSHGNVGGVVEAGDPLAFDLNVNTIKNGYFSPVATVEAEKAKFIQGGGTEANFLKQTRLFKVDRAVTLAGRCTKNGSTDYKVATKMVDFMVEYQGTPNAMTPNQVQPQAKLLAVPLGGNGTINSSFSINNGTIAAVNGEEYNGTCPSNQMFKAVVTGSGQGKVQLHVKRYGQPVYTSGQLNFNGGQLTHNFNIMAEPVNKPAGETENLHFQLYVRSQDNPNDPWTEYEKKGGFSWSMKCQLPNGQNSNAGQNLAPKPMSPDPKPVQQLKIQPQQPKPPVAPTRQIAPVKPTPTPSQPARAQ